MTPRKMTAEIINLCLGTDKRNYTSVSYDYEYL